MILVLQLSHFSAAFIVSLCASTVFGITQRNEQKEMLRYGAYCFVMFLGGALLAEDGRTRIQDLLPGESCERVLSYMNYDREEILDGIWRQLRRAAERKRVKENEAKAIAKDFEVMLSTYTYLEE